MCKANPEFRYVSRLGGGTCPGWNGRKMPTDTTSTQWIIWDIDISSLL